MQRRTLGRAHLPLRPSVFGESDSDSESESPSENSGSKDETHDTAHDTAGEATHTRAQPPIHAGGFPEDAQHQRLVHWTASHVRRHGHLFLQQLLRRRADDPRFTFLTARHTPAHAEYLRLLHDPPANPDTAQAARAARAARARERVAERFGRLVDRAARSGRRRAVARAMSYALEHCSAARELVQQVCGAISSQRGTSGGLGALRVLYVVSDVLRNCAARVSGAWRLRDAVERRLDEIFDGLRKTVGCGLWNEVLGVLALWHRWMVFPELRLVELARMFREGEE
ncbi:hypothetical protein GGI05_003837 [Coemansia sp. RSA 2603]|nr:hypothetical protein GGI05_003837 [Coemansia sp. RSA 2603]